MRRGFRNVSGVAGLAIGVSLLFPPAVLAGHTDPLPSDLESVICELVVDLDVLLGEFDLQVGEFGDDRLNRALDKARTYVAAARDRATLTEITEVARDLRAAMRELEKGAAVPASGSGFSDDLASLGSFFAEVFVEDLMTLSAQLGAATAETVAAATSHFDDGALARDEGEWEAALAHFSKAIRLLDRELEVGAVCQ